MTINDKKNYKNIIENQIHQIKYINIRNEIR